MGICEGGERDLERPSALSNITEFLPNQLDVHKGLWRADSKSLCEP
jgi:hypothetical protein